MSDSGLSDSGCEPEREEARELRPSMTVNGVTFQIDIRKTIVGVVGGIAGYYLWRNRMIAWNGHAAVVPHPCLFAFALAVVSNTKVIYNGRR